jgi:ribosomal protein L13E
MALTGILHKGEEPKTREMHPTIAAGRLTLLVARLSNDSNGPRKQMTTWHKRDWKQFYELARRPWQRHRPPRPIYPTGINRVLPAAGFSLSELDDAGLDLDLAESLGLPVDAGRIGAYGPNVTTLRDFVRSSRQPL